jgi:alpha-1,3-rhamnosyl/mannosyltransferase
MRAGVPVVASGAGSLPEVLGDGALLVNPGEHEELAQALDACLTDEVLRSRMTDAGAARVAEFTWERCADGLEALYRDAAAGHG